MFDAYEAGEGSYVTLAARFAVGEATVKRWVWRNRPANGILTAAWVRAKLRGHGEDLEG